MSRRLVSIVFLFALSGCVTGSSGQTPAGAELEEVDPVDLPLSAYHPVAGWPGWACAESTDGKHSQWYFVENGLDSVSAWNGSCASWIGQTQPSVPDGGPEGDGDNTFGLDREPGDVGDFKVILGWPDWRCADYKDGRDKSVWYQTDQGPNTAVTFKGNCSNRQQ